MSANRTRLLLAAFLFLGVVLLSVRLLDSGEPEPERNPFLCPDCGKLLPEKNAKCLSCASKKTIEKMEAARSGNNSPASEKKIDPDKRNKAIAAGIAFLILMVFAFWPSIHRYLRSRQQGPEIEYRICRCPRCKRKLRYRAMMVGTQGMCPTCKEVFEFPEGDEDDGDDGF